MGHLSFLFICLCLFAVSSAQLLIYNPAARDNLGNTLPGFWDDWITLSRIDYVYSYAGWNYEAGGGAAENPDIDMVLRNITTIKIRNTGTLSVAVSNISVGDSTKFAIVNPPTFPLIIAGNGAFYPLTIEFIASYFVSGGAYKETKYSTLSIISNDTVQPNITAILAGAYMAAPEGGNEIFLSDLIAGFGWTTYVNEIPPTDDLGWPHLSDNTTNDPRGDEVFSSLWTAADPSKPVFIRWAAAFSHCCAGNPFIALEANATDVSGYDKSTNSLHRDGTVLSQLSNLVMPTWSQTVLPANQQDETVYAEGNLDHKNAPAFSFNVDGYSSMGRTWVGLHIYPIRDRNGAIVNNTYFIAQDYSTPYNDGCQNPYIPSGAGYANCDFQDNIVYVTNVKPVGTYPNAPASAATLTGTPFQGTSGYSTGSAIASPTFAPSGNGGTIDGQQTTAPPSTVPGTGGSSAPTTVAQTTTAAPGSTVSPTTHAPASTTSTPTPTSPSSTSATTTPTGNGSPAPTTTSASNTLQICIAMAAIVATFASLL